MTSFLRLTPSRDSKGKLYQENGLIVFRLGLWVDGKEIDSIIVNSGGLGRQEEGNLRTYLDNNSYAGSLEPIPEHEYKVGPPEFATPNSYSGSWGAGLGPVWFDLTPDPLGGNRGEFGIHLDENRSYAPGSAGCVVAPSVATLKKIVTWHNQHKFNRLVVDYGKGTVSKAPTSNSPAEPTLPEFKVFVNDNGATIVVNHTIKPGKYTIYSSSEGWVGKLKPKS